MSPEDFAAAARRMAEASSEERMRIVEDLSARIIAATAEERTQLAENVASSFGAACDFEKVDAAANAISGMLRGRGLLGHEALIAVTAVAAIVCRGINLAGDPAFQAMIAGNLTEKAFAYLRPGPALGNDFPETVGSA